MLSGGIRSKSEVNMFRHHGFHTGCVARDLIFDSGTVLEFINERGHNGAAAPRRCPGKKQNKRNPLFVEGIIEPNVGDAATGTTGA